MNTSDADDQLSTVAAKLERMLAAARGEKTLAQVPALRRLRWVVRTFFFLGALGVMSVLLTGLILYQLHSAVEQARFGISSYIAFALFSLTACVSLAASGLLLCAYSRFLKQFRKNDIPGIRDSTDMMLRVFRYGLLALAISLASHIVMFRNVGASATAFLPGLAIQIVMYLIGRRYVHTAQAELPALAAVAGDDSSLGHYATWKSLFLRFSIIAPIVLYLGYILGGALNRNGIAFSDQALVGGALNRNGHAPVDQALVLTSETMNRTLPVQIDSETRLDATSAGPGNRMTFFYTLVNFSPDNLDRAKFVEMLRRQIINGYKTSPDMASFRSKQVELQCTYRFKDGSPVATIGVSPKDF
jgi:hypothetical protein